MNSSHKHLYRRLFLCLFLFGQVSEHAAAPAAKSKPGNSPYIATNKDVLTFTKQSIGTKVGRGECWDLAQQALDFSGSIWRKPYHFGFLLKKGGTILPGDIIQFDSVRLEWKHGNQSGWKQLGFPRHTAIIYAVKNSQLQLAHQNVNRVKKVVLEVIDLKHVVSGSYQVFRPYKKGP